MSLTIKQLKAEAKALRAKSPGTTQGQALEAVSKSHGFRDWNTALAACKANTEEVPYADRLRKFLTDTLTPDADSIVRASDEFRNQYPQFFMDFPQHDLMEFRSRMIGEFVFEYDTEEKTVSDEIMRSVVIPKIAKFYENIRKPVFPVIPVYAFVYVDPIKFTTKIVVQTFYASKQSFLEFALSTENRNITGEGVEIQKQIIHGVVRKLPSFFGQYMSAPTDTLIVDGRSVVLTAKSLKMVFTPLDETIDEFIDKVANMLGQTVSRSCFPYQLLLTGSFIDPSKMKPCYALIVRYGDALDGASAGITDNYYFAAAPQGRLSKQYMQERYLGMTPDEQLKNEEYWAMEKPSKE